MAQSILQSRKAEAGVGSAPQGGTRIPIVAEIGDLLTWILRWVPTILIILLVIGIVYIMVAAEGSYGRQLGGYIGEQFTGLANGINSVFNSITCSIEGNCNEPASTEPDDRRYGVWFKSDGISPTQNKFYKDQEIVIKAFPYSEIPTDIDKSFTATVICTMENSTLSSIQPKETVPLTDLFKTVFTCRFAPLLSEEGEVKKAEVNITYEMTSTGSMTVSVADKSRYEQYLEQYLIETGSVNQAEEKVAERFQVEADPKSTTRNADITIGIKMHRSQPIPKGDEFANLVVSMTNSGSGYATINKVTLETPTGIRVVSAGQTSEVQDSPIDTWYHLFGGEQLPGIGDQMRPGDIKLYDFTLDTSGVAVDGRTMLKTGRLNVKVDYSYITSGDTYVKVQTCKELKVCKEDLEAEAAKAMIESEEKIVPGSEESQ